MFKAMHDFKELCFGLEVQICLSAIETFWMYRKKE